MRNNRVEDKLISMIDAQRRRERAKRQFEQLFENGGHHEQTLRHKEMAQASHTATGA